MKTMILTGANGLVGTAIRNVCETYFKDQIKIFSIHSSKYDLVDQSDVINAFHDAKDFLGVDHPDFVVHAAARVGGIGRNLHQPVEQYESNILMNTYVIREALFSSCKKFLTFGSVCAFPKDVTLITEDNMHDGEPFPAHRAYAYSKRMMDIQMDAYRQSGWDTEMCSVIPSNIFGENDNYDLENAHVIPMLIHKCAIAKMKNKPLEVWGDGTPWREFIYSQDLAYVCMELLMRDKPMPHRLLVSNQEHQIKDVVGMIMRAFDYDKTYCDLNKPNGQMRRPTSKELFRKEFPDPDFWQTEAAIRKSVQWFQDNFPNVRGFQNERT